MSIKVIKAPGLYTSDNPYATPDGALAQADNVVIRNKDIIEPRRGQAKLSYSLGATPTEIVFYQGSAVLSDASRLYRDTGSSFTTYSGFYTAPVGQLRKKFTEAEKRLYFSTTTGVFLLDGISSSPVAAGVPRPHDIGTASTIAGAPSAAGSWMPPDSSVAYRWVIGRKDANNIVRWGVPSGRYIIVNPPDVTVSLSKTLGGVVTATVTGSDSHSFRVGDNINLSPVSGTFTAGPHAVTAVTSTTFTYTDSAGVATLAGVTATSGVKYTSLYLPLPLAGPNPATTGDFVQVYRTALTPSATIDPGDEMFLIHEGALRSFDVGLGQYEPQYPPTSGPFLDYTSDGALSADPLYTNENTGDGALQTNFAPPHTNDITTWNNRLWYANTSELQRFSLRLLGTGSPSGVQDGDTITIGGRTFTAKHTTATADQFTLTDSSSSASMNIRETTKAFTQMVKAQWEASSVAFRAFLASGPDDPPGLMDIEGQTLGASPIYFAASRPASWNPQPAFSTSSAAGGLARVGANVHVTVDAFSDYDFVVGQQVLVTANTPDPNYTTGVKTISSVPGGGTFSYTDPVGNAFVSTTDYVIHGLTVFSSDNAGPNRIYYSKLQQPDAVPLVNFLDVGSKNTAILRIIPLKDKLYVFKEDGIYIISGEEPFRVDLLDNTVKLIAPDSAVVVSNRIFALTSQGVVSITEGGAGIVSRAIENDIMPLIWNCSDSFKQACFGVAYETERQYLLWMPSSSSGATPDQCYVFHVLNQCWTRRTDSAFAGKVSPADYLWLGSPAVTDVTKERKSNDRTDYADGTVSVTISSGTVTTATVSSAAGVSVGDYLVAGNGVSGVITDVTSNVLTFVNETVSAPSNGAATVYVGYPCTVVYNPQAGGVASAAAQSSGPAPGTTKQFREITMHFQSPNFNLGYITTTSELSGVTKSDIIALANTGLANARKSIPRENQRAAVLQPGFTIRNARGKWRLLGYSLEAEGMSERNSR